MKRVLITGATSGIGLAISKKLLSMGHVVYGVGRDFSKVDIENNNFYTIVCDLIKYQNIEEMVKKLKKEVEIDILINCAGIGYFGPHEEINPTKLHKMIALNLEAPLILTQLLLRDLKKREGVIINISSITATKSSTYGCAYSATKAGLVHFSKGLFDEVRKTGVQVISILPDITKTPFYDELNFREGEEEESYILPECVADAVENILSQRRGTVITEVIIQPQKHIIRRK
ncbi:MAG: SDR family NAD(P)-dependent oxidoreductase [Candidatus Fusobacterium pullicola]|uniref:SDR family NAD(P)-dependent oxidoreductase n=1 Tax=Candidatus Fusobacterium pullicola TaxID=2838601 RepID=A0A9E2NZI7_9FUSO|nr:SDR family NAD(P)-dependent oxidoreductase [Candidatus Fusobacterium pullicola]